MTVEVRRTACSRDCPDACGLLVEVEGGRVTKLRGDPDHPVTDGFLCFRTNRYVEQQYSDERLTTAYRRVGDRFEPIEVEAALKLAAEKLVAIRAESGPDAILHYRSGGSLGYLKTVADRFFGAFGPCASKVGSICSGAGEAAQEFDFGVCESNRFDDVENSRHIILWGKNPTISSVHLVPRLRAARAAGAKIALIDPVRQKSAALADVVLAPRPGRDLELALGVGLALDRGPGLHPLAAERCEDLPAWRTLVGSRSLEAWAEAAGVTEADLEALASWLAAGPTSIHVGWGLQRRRRGAATVRALDALSAVSGNLYIAGGGCSFMSQRGSGLRPQAIAPPLPARALREPLLGADILAAADPPIRAVWVTAANPVAMLPDAATVATALESREFTVVADFVWTDTARRADLVLPIPSMLEDTDVIGSYGHEHLVESNAVVDPPAGVLHEADLFRRLGQLVGLGDTMEHTVEDYRRMVLGDRARDRDRTVARRAAEHDVLFASGKVPTPSGKVRLLTSIDAPVVEDGDYPLWLFSNSTRESQSSQWAGRGLGERTWVAVHPQAAAGRAAGDLVTVESRHGVLEAELRFDEGLRHDIALMPKGGHYDRGHCANVLIEARATDDGLGAAYLDCQVRLR